MMARKAKLNNGWNHVQRVNKQNQFVPSAVLTRTGKILVNTAKASSTKNFSTDRQSFNRQTVLTSTAMKVNTVKPIVNRVRPANVFYKTHSSSSRPFKKTTVLRTDFSKQKVNAAKAQIIKLKKQAKPVIKHHRAWLTSVSLKQRLTRKSFSKKQRVHKESVSKQGRKFAKGESSVQRDPLFDEIPEDTVDRMDTENAQDEGRTREIVDEDKEIEENVLSTEDVPSTDKEEVSTDRPIVSTDKHNKGTEEPNEGTDGQNEGIEEHIEGTEENLEGTKEHKKGTEEQVKSTDGHKKGTKEEIAAQATQTSTQTPTSRIFRDDETIAKVLLNMSQAKAVSREKE
ncbi:hypothetical protein Tco_1560475, partial [Tanacetum coccineum]